MKRNLNAALELLSRTSAGRAHVHGMAHQSKNNEDLKIENGALKDAEYFNNLSGANDASNSIPVETEYAQFTGFKASGLHSSNQDGSFIKKSWHESRT